MSIWRLSFKNLLARQAATFLTLLILVAGVTLGVLLISLSQGLDSGFRNNIKGIDMVVGAKGSPLQLILAAVYHIDNPTGNISKAEADSLARNPLIAQAIPVSFGDSYKAFRIVGTIPAYLALYEVEYAQGAIWSKAFEAVIGADVAAETGLGIGDSFYSAHGLDGLGESHGDHPFTVVGILQRSSTVADRLVLCDLQSIWDVHGHAEEEAETDREITAMLIRFKNKMGILTLPRLVNERTSFQAAVPAIEVNRLFDLLGLGFTILRIMAYAITILGILSLFASLMNSLKDRAYDMALMRAMGANPRQIFAIVCAEAVILGTIGAGVGLLFGKIALWVLTQLYGAEIGLQFTYLSLSWGELALALLTIVLCLIAAIYPALRTMKIDVANTLTDYAN